jgi:hypothetical protein
MSGTLVGTGSGGGGGSSTLTSYISVSSATVATSTLTGALQVTGGAGIGKDLFVGGPIVVGIGSYLGSSAQLQINGNTQVSGAEIARSVYAQGGNLLVYSQDWSQVNWSKTNLTQQAGATYSPDGTLNATKLNETATSGNHWVQQTISQTGPVTFSAFLQAGEKTYGALNLTIAGSSHAAWFNLTTGAVASTTASPIYPIVARCEPIPIMNLCVPAFIERKSTLHNVYEE